jgi:DNA modification methylase
MEPTAQKIKIIYKQVAELRPYKNNPRKNDAAVEFVAKSIQEFGFKNPIILGKDDEIVCGHTRLKAALHLGLVEVPCIYATDLTDEQIRAYRLADNKTAERALWDDDLLAVELGDLNIDMAAFGFDAVQMEPAEDDGFDIDKALEDQPFVRPGDVWTLGRHRLVCGDSTKAEDVLLLMDGKRANLCVTDAPYNCDYEGGTGMKIANDRMSGEAFYKFLLAAFTNIYNVLVDGAAFYAFHSDAEKVNFYNATVNAGFHYSTTCIWAKNSLVIGRMDYQMRHEPVIYAFKDTAKHKWYSNRKQTTIWEFDRPTRSKLHPTTKPIPLICYPIQNSSAPNEIVLDAFGGSGSTLIACEQMERICFMMELDPKYASVIVQRFRDQVGTVAGIAVERGGHRMTMEEALSVQSL